MNWTVRVSWVLKSIFTCNHWRTPVNEGKCFCPDCGCGLIYQWMILRCAECCLRRESRYFLRQVLPAQRCCPFCGSDDFQVEVLESPAYFQLEKARLVVHEVGLPDREILGRWTAGWAWVQAWVESPAPRLRLLPAVIRV